jgi:SSS family solute:Na+ symporter
LLKDTTHVFDLGVWCFSGFSGLFPIVFASVYWHRTTAAGVIASLAVTAAIWVSLFLTDILGDKAPGEEMLILGMMPVAPIFLASAVTLVLVSLATRAPDEGTLRKFFQAR